MRRRLSTVLLLCTLATSVSALEETVVQGNFRTPFLIPHNTTRQVTAFCPVLRDLGDTLLSGQLLDARVRWETDLSRSLYRGIRITQEDIVGDVFIVTVENYSAPFATDIELILTLTCRYRSLI